MSKSMVQLSVKIFQFFKPGLIKHVLLVWIELKTKSDEADQKK